jgi:type II secretory pathway component PulJ
MRVPPQSYRLYKTLYAFAYNRLCRTWPGKITLICLSFISGYGCASVFNRMMTKEERMMAEEMRQLEKIERMLERAARLRAAAAAHRRELGEAEKEEARLREMVGEWDNTRESSKIKAKVHDL